MSTASLAFYMISLFFICAVSFSAGMPTRRPISELSLQEREELYRQTPPVPDERLADAELDSAYDTFNLRPRKPTENPTRM